MKTENLFDDVYNTESESTRADQNKIESTEAEETSSLKITDNTTESITSKKEPSSVLRPRRNIIRGKIVYD